MINDEAFSNVLLWALIVVVIGVVGLAWIFMLLDCLLRNFNRHGQITGHPKWDKFIWFVIVLTVVGAVVYYFLVRRKASHI